MWIPLETNQGRGSFLVKLQTPSKSISRFELWVFVSIRFDELCWPKGWDSNFFFFFFVKFSMQ